LGNLDHALANESALAKTIDVTEWHINADEPVALAYNTKFKTDAQIINFYAADAYRSSDHDPVLVSLQLDASVVEEPVVVEPVVVEPAVVEPVVTRSSGGSLSIILFGLLIMIRIRRRK
jgi:hypothetical protein